VWSAVMGDSDMMVVIVMMHGGSNNNNCGIDKYHELIVSNKIFSSPWKIKNKNYFSQKKTC